MVFCDECDSLYPNLRKTDEQARTVVHEENQLPFPMTYLAMMFISVGLSSAANGGQEPVTPPSPWVVELSVQCKSGRVEAILSFQNTSSKDAYLVNYNVGEGELIENNVLAVTCADKKIPYIGKYVKRAAPTEEDFVRVAPGQTLQRSIRLDKMYRFPSVKHSCRAVYEAYHPHPRSDDLDKFEVEFG
jgi:hypothetical protein